MTGPDEPCNVSGELKPPKALDDVCADMPRMQQRSMEPEI